MQQVVPFDNVQITSSVNEKLFGVTLDPEVKFEEPIRRICNAVNKNTMLFILLPIT